MTASVAEPVHAVGVPTPRLLRADLDATPPFAVFETLPGAPGYVVAGHDLAEPIFVTIAADMGSLLPHIAQVPTRTLPLPPLWGDPQGLAGKAAGWLEIVGTWFTAVEVDVLESVIASVPSLFRARSPVLAHGDYGLANVLVENGRITGLLDFEFTRLADPLFDVAWWGWLARFHTPDAFSLGWEPFLRAAGVDAAAPDFADQVFALQALRILELVVDVQPRGPDAQKEWARRLSETLGWR